MLYKMSVKRLAVIAAVSSYANNNNTSSTTYYNLAGTSGNGSAFGTRRGHHSMRTGTTLHGNVNILLGGVMLSVVVAIVCVVCYCCHRSIKKRTSLYRQRWLENDPNIEIYSVEQCYETSGLFLETSEILPNAMHAPISGRGEPPPSYDVVLAMDEMASRPSPPPRYRANESNQYKAEGPKYTSNTVDDLYNDNIRAENSESIACSLERESEPIRTARLGTHKSTKIVSSNDNYYYSGCPLCGKFQYTSPSIDSQFENFINADVENGNEENNCDCPPKERTTSIRKPLNEVSEEVILVNSETSTQHQTLDLNSNAVQDSLNNNQLLGSSDVYPQNHLSSIVRTPEGSNLDSINENGIVRLDMSRIMDKTGLPTYEAALKLESSGYV